MGKEAQEEIDNTGLSNFIPLWYLRILFLEVNDDRRNNPQASAILP